MSEITTIAKGQSILERLEERFTRVADQHRDLAHPGRLAILALLREFDELTVSQIAGILKSDISAISHQLRILENADLVIKERCGRTMCYQLSRRGKTMIGLGFTNPFVIKR